MQKHFSVILKIFYSVAIEIFLCFLILKMPRKIWWEKPWQSKKIIQLKCEMKYLIQEGKAHFDQSNQVPL